MTRIGAWSAIGAVTIAIATAATWNIGDREEQSATVSASGADLFRSKGCSGCHVGPD
jgi:mono/diheme cytochrome c family protein